MRTYCACTTVYTRTHRYALVTYSAVRPQFRSRERGGTNASSAGKEGYKLFPRHARHGGAHVRVEGGIFRVATGRRTVAAYRGPVRGGGGKDREILYISYTWVRGLCTRGWTGGRGVG